MASWYVQYAIRNVQTGKFVRYMSNDGSQYAETDITGNMCTFDNEFQVLAYLNEKVKWVDSSGYFEVVKLYTVTPY
jgi:hypothetical protein